VKLYGKNNLSNNKLRAFDNFSKGKDFGEISRDLRIQRATAEVYTINASKDIDTDHLSELLEITEESFSQIQRLLSSKDCLNEVKEALPEVSYNQTRFVVAVVFPEQTETGFDNTTF